MKKFSIVLFFVASLFTGLTSIGHAGGHLPDLVETAVKGGKFKTLVTAVEAAGLVETLKGKGPFTVFAPTDEAFAKIDSSTSDLQKYPYCQFCSILVPKLSQFRRFHLGKIWLEGFTPCKKIDILQLCSLR